MKWPEITRRQAVETGMAFVLLALLAGILTEKMVFYPVATGLLLINMTFPDLYKPLAMVWLGLAQLLSIISSNIILTLLFALLVVPVGIGRRWRGYDPLLLKGFRRDTSSVMKVREHWFTATDLKKPY